MELTLGPLFFNWPAERLRTFYARIADEAPVDRVYLGEVVCGKRAPLLAEALLDAAERLARGGKEVVWSTLALPASRRDRKANSSLAADGGELVELNEFGGLTQRAGQRFVAGPFLNVYNESAAEALARRGCVRWCPPVELPLAWISTVAHAVPSLEVELFAFGRVPLALSGRCYHARAHGLNKDSCQFVCERDPDGMDVKTLDAQPFLAVNGVQTLSHAVQVVASTPQALRAAGISALRLSPHDVDMVRAAELFRDFLDERSGADALTAGLKALGLPGGLANGYLSGEAGHRWTVPA